MTILGPGHPGMGGNSRGAGRIRGRQGHGRPSSSRIKPLVTLLESRTLLATTTVTTLMLSAPSLTYGQTENLTATVTNPAGGEAPTGSVSFMDGSTLLNTQQAALSPAGVAMYTTTATQLPAGTDDLTAVSIPPAASRAARARPRGLSRRSSGAAWAMKVRPRTPRSISRMAWQWTHLETCS